MGSSLDGLVRDKIALAFYEAEKHVPAKDGHCEKCGFIHCEAGHVLAMAQQGVEAALAQGSGDPAWTCEACGYKSNDIGEYRDVCDKCCKLAAQGSAGARERINSQLHDDSAIDSNCGVAAARGEGSGKDARFKRIAEGNHHECPEVCDCACHKLFGERQVPPTETIPYSFDEGKTWQRGEGSGLREALETLLSAAEKCRHWHDAMRNDKGETEGVIIAKTSWFGLKEAEDVARRALAAAHPAQAKEKE